jgi:uncharacterized repeat protein (TIGR01451 family)/CSLREA domain-containing protein
MNSLRSLFYLGIVLFVPTTLLGFSFYGLNTMTVQVSDFNVNSSIDETDANPGDGICETEQGNGICTLRAAIQETNSLPGKDSIFIPTGTYTLTIQGNLEDFAATGDLDITDDLEIQGSGAVDTIIDANAIDRVFHLTQLSDVEISGVTIRGGGNISSGGGIFNSGGGTLIVKSCVIRDNQPTFNGGGIDNFEGVVTISNTRITNNQALGTTQSQGGGIFNNDGTLTVIESEIDNNDAFYHGGGISSRGVLTVNKSIIHNNTALSEGGGIYIYLSGLLTQTNVSLYGNYAAREGGGISHHGDIALVMNSTIYSNTTNLSGGGIHNLGSITLTNSTVSFNTADDYGGGIFNGGQGYLANTTVFSNNAVLGGGIYQRPITGTIKVNNSIVVSNTLGNDCSGTITPLGYNMESDGFCGFSLVANPQLLPLMNNGGSTPTHALSDTSPAIDAGDPSGCKDNHGNLLEYDQRGYLRSVDGDGDEIAICDIGAYEYTTADLSISKSNHASTVVPGSSVTYTIVLSNSGPAAVIGAAVTDTFPSEITNINWECIPNINSYCDPESGSGDIDIDVMIFPLDPLTITAFATIDSTASGYLTNTAMITPPLGVFDPNFINNSSTDVDILNPEADVQLEIVDNPDPVVPGGQVTYTLTISNQGPSDSISLVVTDTLPSGTMFLNVSGIDWMCEFITGDVICTRPYLDSGISSHITLTVKSPITSGIMTNTAYVSGLTFDPDLDNNTASTSTVLNHPPQISPIADQETKINTIITKIPFTITDAETPATDLILTVTSSDQEIIPDSNLLIGGSGENRTLTIIPAQDTSGTSTITVFVYDGISSSDVYFNVSITGDLIYLPLINRY